MGNERFRAFRKAKDVSRRGQEPKTSSRSDGLDRTFVFNHGEKDMGDKGSKDKGKREQQKKAQHTPAEKRKLKREKKMSQK